MKLFVLKWFYLLFKTTSGTQISDESTNILFAPLNCLLLQLVLPSLHLTVFQMPAVTIPSALMSANLKVKPRLTSVWEFGKPGRTNGLLCNNKRDFFLYITIAIETLLFPLSFGAALARCPRLRTMHLSMHCATVVRVLLFVVFVVLGILATSFLSWWCLVWDVVHWLCAVSTSMLEYCSVLLKLNLPI